MLTESNKFTKLNPTSFNNAPKTKSHFQPCRRTGPTSSVNVFEWKMGQITPKKTIKHYTHLFQVLFERLPNPREGWRAAFTTDSTVNRPDCKIFTTQVNWGALVRLSLFINVALSVCSKAFGSVCEYVESWLTHQHTNRLRGGSVGIRVLPLR